MPLVERIEAPARACTSARKRSATALAAYLLKDARTALVPGEAFGAPEYVRFSYATGMENIVAGLDRIDDAIRRLS